MVISPIQPNPNSPLAAVRPAPFRKPQGLAQTPDRLEERRRAAQDDPPSLFKKFLFEPIFQVLKWILRGIFIFFDFLRSSAFEENPQERALSKEDFLTRLKETLKPEMVLHQFRKIYSKEEQAFVYQSIGEAHKERISWKEMIWERGAPENTALGRKLVSQNPFLLRDYL